MKTAIISAKYTEQGPLERFFAEVFGINKAEVRVSKVDYANTIYRSLNMSQFTRGRYQCTIPRGLNKVRRVFLFSSNFMFH
jgi:hypothetical protein